jgi:hypothetical protein
MYRLSRKKQRSLRDSQEFQSTTLDNGSKFDGGPSRQSAYVRLLLVCAGESGIVPGVRPVRTAFVLTNAAGFVRSFVRSQSGHRQLSMQLYDIVRLE